MSPVVDEPSCRWARWQMFPLADEPAGRWARTPDRWHTGPLAHRTAGTPDRWRTGPLAHWTAGTLDRWHTGPLLHWTAGYTGPLATPDRWHTGPAGTLTCWHIDPLWKAKVQQAQTTRCHIMALLHLLSSLTALLPVIASFQPIALLPHPPLLILHPFIVWLRCSSYVALMWERKQTHFISQALSIPLFIHNDRKQQLAYRPLIHDRTLYLARCRYRCTMQPNREVQDFIDNHTHNECKNHNACNTLLGLMRT